MGRGRGWLRYVVPHVAIADLPAMLGVAAVGALLAALYGIAHDQLTYTISPEDFTKFEFHQFSYANFGWPDRAFAALIGALATWWVGGIAAWFLARRAMPGRPRSEAIRRIGVGFACVFGAALVAGIVGYAIGLWRGPDGDYSGWESSLRARSIEDVWAFVRVAYIHNAGYAGALVGLVLGVGLAGVEFRPVSLRHRV